MNYITWPYSGNNPVGKVSHKFVRMTQTRECNWSAIETSAGVYSPAALAIVDQMITFQRQQGATVCFGLYATPAFYASATAHPTYGDNVTKGPWNITAECANPTSLSAVANFATMMINRYNKPGGAWYDVYGATLGKGIQAWETWNEPRGDDSNGNVTGSGGPGSGAFFWGSVAQMVDLTQTQYAAIKAADASVVVTTPGMDQAPTTAANFPRQFLTTTGPSTSKTGRESCDVYYLHIYRHNNPGVTLGTYKNDCIWGPLGVKTLRDWLNANGWGSMPIWVGEWGVDYSTLTSEIAAFYGANAGFRYSWVARTLMLMAAHGVKNIQPWVWSQTGGLGCSGDWFADTQGVQKAYNDFASKAVGRTIASATFALDGPVALRFTDGTSWTV